MAVDEVLVTGLTSGHHALQWRHSRLMRPGWTEVMPDAVHQLKMDSFVHVIRSKSWRERTLMTAIIQTTKESRGWGIKSRNELARRRENSNSCIARNIWKTLFYYRTVSDVCSSVISIEYRSSLLCSIEEFSVTPKTTNFLIFRWRSGSIYARGFRTMY